jgi:hypothetical protein
VVVRVPRPPDHTVAVPPAEPVVVAGEVVDYTVPLPGHASHENPLQGWIEQGQQLVARLTNELESVQHKLTEQRQILDALTGQHALLLGQRDQAEAAVRHAIGLAEGHPPTPPTAPAPPAVNAAGRSIGPGGRFAPPPGKVTQKDWVLGRLVPGEVLRIADLRDAFVAEYPMAPGVATQNISSILGYQRKARDRRFPAVEREHPGAYRAFA